MNNPHALARELWSLSLISNTISLALQVKHSKCCISLAQLSQVPSFHWLDWAKFHHFTGSTKPSSITSLAWPSQVPLLHWLDRVKFHHFTGSTESSSITSLARPESSLPLHFCASLLALHMTGEILNRSKGVSSWPAHLGAALWQNGWFPSNPYPVPPPWQKRGSRALKQGHNSKTVLRTIGYFPTRISLADTACDTPLLSFLFLYSCTPASLTFSSLPPPTRQSKLSHYSPGAMQKLHGNHALATRSVHRVNISCH